MTWESWVTLLGLPLMVAGYVELTSKIGRRMGKMQRPIGIALLVIGTLIYVVDIADRLGGLRLYRGQLTSDGDLRPNLYIPGRAARWVWISSLSLRERNVRHHPQHAQKRVQRQYHRGKAHIHNGRPRCFTVHPGSDEFGSGEYSHCYTAGREDFAGFRIGKNPSILISGVFCPYV